MEPGWKSQTRHVLPESSPPMMGALGREPRVRAALEALPLHERRELATVLAELTRPLNPRELDDALMVTGLSRGDRKKLTKALKGFPIIMVAAQNG
jgi:hypothetical protein